MVVEFRLAFERNFQANHMRLSSVQIGFDFLRSEMPAIAIVSRSHFVFSLDFSYSFKAFRVAKAIVRLTFLYKFFGIFFVKFETLALNIRSILAAFFAAFFAAFVPFDSKPAHRFIKIFDIFFAVARAICIFEAQNDFAKR